jgi:Cu-Zn family superoxide dismutase
MIRKASLAAVIMLASVAGLRAQTTIELKPTEGNKASGTISAATMGKGVHFTGTVSGLTPGKHGFHIHEKGDCSAPDGTSAGGHFNPDQKPHGAPNAAEHHAGDLGNIEAGADGVAKVNMHVNGIDLDSDAHSIKGKAIIIHAAADDLTTQPTGNAGARVACGVIN